MITRKTKTGISYKFSDKVKTLIAEGQTKFDAATFWAGVEAVKAGLKVSHFRTALKQAGVGVSNGVAKVVFDLVSQNEVEVFEDEAVEAIQKERAKLARKARKARAEKKAGKATAGKPAKSTKSTKAGKDKTTLTSPQVVEKWLTVQVKKGVITPEMTVEEVLHLIKNPKLKLASK